MTLEKLLGISAAELASYTDTQLLEFFGPVLNVTRPEKAAENPVAAKNNGTVKRNKGPAPGSNRAKALEIAKKLNLDLGI